MPGRFIGENVAYLRDVVDYTTKFNVPAAILSLDQEKAFDRVDWDFMLATLGKMGFGPSFVNWVSLPYTNVQSTVKVNGYLSPFFFLSRGVRQGCPLSPLLYVLVAEVFAINIRANPRIVGLLLPGSSETLSPISQYVDDTSLIVCSDDAIRACFDTYSVFQAESGAKLNQSKSKRLWLGSGNNRANPPAALDWTSVKIEVLGVFLSPGNLEEDNWRPRINAVENVLSSWKQWILSYKGRALVINALALSGGGMWPLSFNLNFINWFLIFLWKGKRDLVGRCVVVQSPSLGAFP